MLGKLKLQIVIIGVMCGYCNALFAATLVSFYAKDQHGSIAGATDTNGNLTKDALNQYNDYGVNQSDLNHQGNISISYDSYQYSGEYTDNESGLQPLGNGYRYYDPSLMRFISPDSYPLLNLYAYSSGNPIGNVDPTGHMNEAASGSEMLQDAQDATQVVQGVDDGLEFLSVLFAEPEAGGLVPVFNALIDVVEDTEIKASESAMEATANAAEKIASNNTEIKQVSLAENMAQDKVQNGSSVGNQAMTPADTSPTNVKDAQAKANEAEKHFKDAMYRAKRENILFTKTPKKPVLVPIKSQQIAQGFFDYLNAQVKLLQPSSDAIKIIEETKSLSPDQAVIRAAVFLNGEAPPRARLSVTALINEYQKVADLKEELGIDSNTDSDTDSDFDF